MIRKYPTTHFSSYSKLFRRRNFSTLLCQIRLQIIHCTCSIIIIICIKQYFFVRSTNLPFIFQTWQYFWFDFIILFRKFYFILNPIGIQYILTIFCPFFYANSIFIIILCANTSRFCIITLKCIPCFCRNLNRFSLFIKSQHYCLAMLCTCSPSVIQIDVILF